MARTLNLNREQIDNQTNKFISDSDDTEFITMSIDEEKKKRNRFFEKLKQNKERLNGNR